MEKIEFNPKIEGLMYYTIDNHKTMVIYTNKINSVNNNYIPLIDINGYYKSHLSKIIKLLKTVNWNLTQEEIINSKLHKDVHAKLSYNLY